MAFFFSRLYPEKRYDGLIHKDQYPEARIDFTATGHKPVDTIYRTVKLYKPAPRERDTIPPLAVKVKKKNVMDTPGIKEFELGEVYELGHFYYEYDKYKLNTEQKLILDTLMAQLTRHKTLEIEVIAHTDCRGTKEYNMELSKNRALSVVTYLVEHGISKKRLKYKGVGFTEPTIPCPDCQSCTEEQHIQNRLLEFKVLRL